MGVIDHRLAHMHKDEIVAPGSVALCGGVFRSSCGSDRAQCIKCIHEEIDLCISVVTLKGKGRTCVFNCSYEAPADGPLLVGCRIADGHHGNHPGGRIVSASGVEACFALGWHDSCAQRRMAA